MSLPIEHFAQWLANGERGLSSEAIVERLTGVRVGRYGGRRDHPYDPADFRRCEALLRAYPLARLVFFEMRDVSPTWARLVDAWDELAALAESEGVFDSGNWSAPLTYARIVALRREDASSGHVTAEAVAVDLLLFAVVLTVLIFVPGAALWFVVVLAVAGVIASLVHDDQRRRDGRR